MSTLIARPGVVTLAFHVDYWDSLGWKDRFARHDFSVRQSAARAADGASFVYTPQVLIDGRDTPDWPRWQAPPTPGVGQEAPVALALAAEGSDLSLQVMPGPLAPARLSGYVAVVDDGLGSRPSAGENRGANLREDAVVRELLPWSYDASAGARPIRLQPAAPAEAGATRRYVAVATGADGRPVQAVTLACSR